MKVIIAGSRDFKDYTMLTRYCDKILLNQINIEIVSGTASGADRLGEKYTIKKGYPIKKFPADWDKFKKAAGPIRNRKMAEYADGLIAFWNSKSKGTENMIQEANKLNLKVKVIKY